MDSQPYSQSIVPNVEWELLSEPKVFSPAGDANFWPAGTHLIRAFRDGSYRLRAVAKGNIDIREPGGIDAHGNPISYLSPVGAPGDWPSLFSAAASEYSLRYQFEQCTLAGTSRRGRSRDNNNVDNFEVDILVGEIRGEYAHAGPRLWLTDWFLNGTSSRTFFSRATRRKLDKHFGREREGSGIPAFTPRPGGVQDVTMDYLLIDTDVVKCIVAKVPDGLGPAWSQNVSIEYHDAWRVPDKNTREAVAEFVGFMMGRRLLRVGSTEIGESGVWSTRTAANPPGMHIESVCALDDYCPLMCGGEYRDPANDNWGECERVLSDLLPRYLESREDLRLADALRRYFQSFEVPVEAAISSVASAVEILNDGWYRSTKTKAPKHYMLRKDFEDLVGGELIAIAGELEKAVPEYAQQMMNRIRAAYNVPTSRRVAWFLTQIGQPPSEFEVEILRSRNGAVHGGRFDTEEGVDLLADAYRTLFNRVFLTILGYGGTYLDRSRAQWRLRCMNESVGG